jgi:hypothetical protein
MIKLIYAIYILFQIGGRVYVHDAIFNLTVGIVLINADSKKRLKSDILLLITVSHISLTSIFDDAF